MTALLREAAGPARPAPHDLIIDPGAVTEPRRHLIPRFSDPVGRAFYLRATYQFK